jgi:hypothetical protein
MLRSKRARQACPGPGSRLYIVHRKGEENRYVFLELLGLTENELSSYVMKGVNRDHPLGQQPVNSCPDPHPKHLQGL